MKREFCLEKVCQEIYASFDCNVDNIFKQVEADKDRMSITKYDKLPIKYLMLCTQAPFYYLFKVVYDTYTLPGQIVVASDDTPIIRLDKKMGYYRIIYKKSFNVVDERLDALCCVTTWGFVDDKRFVVMFD